MSDAHTAHSDTQPSLLRIDLTRRTTRREELDEATLRRYIGGYALGAKLLYDEVPAGVAWSDPANRLMFLGGVLSASPMPGAGGVTVCAKGAMTGGAAATQAQGNFGANLRRCGYLGVVFQGASDDWVYVYVDEAGQAHVRDATHLLGLDTWETVDAVAADLQKQENEVSVFAIGPAGEHRVRFAAVVADKGHVAGHNGVGAVMGSKKLKAVAVARGKQRVPVADPPRAKAVFDEFMRPVKDNKAGIHYFGTLSSIHRNYETAKQPVLNYTTSVWEIEPEEYAKFTGEYMHAHFDPQRPQVCWACSNRHCQFMTITEGPYAGMVVEEPEYEQVSAFSANIGVSEIGSVMVLGNLVDRLGLDTNEAGWVCSFAMECCDRGILTVEDMGGRPVQWGDAAGTQKLLRRIAQREGIGDVLAEGVRLAAQQIGRGATEIGIYTLKGATPRGHDHRARWHELFDTTISESGALENSMLSIVDTAQFGLPDKIHPYDPDLIARAEAKMKGAMQLEDSAVTCRFNTNMNVKLLAQAITAVTGWDFSFDEGMAVGRRAVNTMRAFNIRHGLTADLDRPSHRYASTPHDGQAQGMGIAAHFATMVQTYYERMGWDAQGKPLPETLLALGLEQVVAELWGTATAKT